MLWQASADLRTRYTVDASRHDVPVRPAHITSPLPLIPGGAASLDWTTDEQTHAGTLSLVLPKHRHFPQLFVDSRHGLKIKHFPDEDASDRVTMPLLTGWIRWSELMTSLVGWRVGENTYTRYKYTCVPRQIKVNGANTWRDKGGTLQSKFFRPLIIESFNCDTESYSNLALWRAL